MEGVILSGQKVGVGAVSTLNRTGGLCASAGHKGAAGRLFNTHLYLNQDHKVFDFTFNFLRILITHGTQHLLFYFFIGDIQRIMTLKLEFS